MAEPLAAEPNACEPAAQRRAPASCRAAARGLSRALLRMASAQPLALLFAALVALVAGAGDVEAQGYAWGVRALRAGDIEVRVDEATARRELRIEARPELLAPKEAQRTDARPIYASYAEAAAHEGRLALTASVLESKVLRFWLQAEVAYERARYFGLVAAETETLPRPALPGWRELIAELCVAARVSGARSAYIAFASALAAAEWAPALDAEAQSAVAAELARLRRTPTWNAPPNALADSAWGFAAHRLDLALGQRVSEARWIEAAAEVLALRPATRAALQRWAALDALLGGPFASGLLVDGVRDGAFYERPTSAWPGALEATSANELARVFGEPAPQPPADFPAYRLAAWRALWSDADDEVLSRLADRGAVSAFARSAVRQGGGVDAAFPRVPESDALEVLALQIPEASEELWLAPELGAMPHVAYLRQAADGFAALSLAIEDRLGAELAAALRCWSQDTRFGFDLVAEIRHLEDLHRGALAWICDQLGLDWKRTGEEKLYRALGRRDYAARFTAEMANDPLLLGDVRRVIVEPREPGRYLCRACVGVAVWHGVLRYTEPPQVSLYGPDGADVAPGRLAIGFQDAPLHLPHEIWIAFTTAAPPDDATWRRAVAEARDLEALRARFAR